MKDEKLKVEEIVRDYFSSGKIKQKGYTFILDKSQIIPKSSIDSLETFYNILNEVADRNKVPVSEAELTNKAVKLGKSENAIYSIYADKKNGTIVIEKYSGKK